MAQYNYLSGSSIDNITNLMFEALESGNCYFGFAKGSPENQWGISTLINIEHTATDLETAVAISGSNTQDKFYDINSRKVIPSTEIDKQNISIVKYSVTDTGFEIPIPLNVGTLKLVYINSNWVVIQGLVNNYFELMPYDSNYVYFIKNWNGNKDIQLKIKNKTFTNLPYITTLCSLWYKQSGMSNYELLQDNLEKTTNILGETFITGLNSPNTIDNGILDMGVNGFDNKSILLSASFQLRSTINDIIINDMSLINPELGTAQLYTESSLQKFLKFDYNIGSTLQSIKVIVGSNQVNSLAIWQESLPYSSITPVADGNPPGLDISYLKNPNFHSSIFDVNGFVKIDSSNISYVKELNNLTDKSYYLNAKFSINTTELLDETQKHSGIVKTSVSTLSNTIPLKDIHSFVVGDVVYIPIMPQTENSTMGSYTVTSVDYTLGSGSITLSSNISIGETLLEGYTIYSEPTNIASIITLAETSNKEKAISYGFTNIMISKDVPLTGTFSPTEKVYRQLFISYKPKNSLGTIIDNLVLNGDYSECGVNFNINNWKYDNGMILYLSNKLPVYRKWASSNEQFKIII